MLVAPLLSANQQRGHSMAGFKHYLTIAIVAVVVIALVFRSSLKKPVTGIA